jgi:molybdate transport system substrate-binding protein
VQVDQLKRREPTEPELPPAPLLWLLGGVAVALAALPAIFAGSPASKQDEVLTVLAASSMQSKQDEALTVLAASSMQNALDDINAAFTKSTGVNVIARYAPGSTLIKQIAQGAEADVFASADPDWMDWGLKKGLIKDARVNLLGNRLVLIAPKDSKLHSVAIGPNFDLAKLAGDGSIAIADVQEVPTGKYAALETLGAWQAAAPKLAMARSVRATLTMVERGVAPLGIVYTSDAKVSSGVKIIGTFPAEFHPPITYAVAVTVTAKPKAVGYLVYLRSMTAVWLRISDPAHLVGWRRTIGGRRHLLALAPGKLATGHRREPDVSVEADLMAGVAGEHRATARLRQVADEEPAPADLGSLVGEPFEELHQARIAPVAIARQAHHLPSLAVDR